MLLDKESLPHHPQTLLLSSSDYQSHRNLKQMKQVLTRCYRQPQTRATDILTRGDVSVCVTHPPVGFKGVDLQMLLYRQFLLMKQQNKTLFSHSLVPLLHLCCSACLLVFPASHSTEWLLSNGEERKAFGSSSSHVLINIYLFSLSQSLVFVRKLRAPGCSVSYLNWRFRVKDYT